MHHVETHYVETSHEETEEVSGRFKNGVPQLEDLPLELIDRILVHLGNAEDISRFLVTSRAILTRSILCSGEMKRVRNQGSSF